MPHFKFKVTVRLLWKTSLWRSWQIILSEKSISVFTGHSRFSQNSADNIIVNWVNSERSESWGEENWVLFRILHSKNYSIVLSVVRAVSASWTICFLGPPLMTAAVSQTGLNATPPLGSLEAFIVSVVSFSKYIFKSFKSGKALASWGKESIT